MKFNFSKNLVKPQINTIEDIDRTLNYLYQHTQSLTDTLIQVINGGLSLSREDSNLPISILKSRLTSGIPVSIPAYGATIVYVGDNAIIDKFAYRTVGQKNLEVTVLFDDDGTHDIVFLVVNERLP